MNRLVAVVYAFEQETQIEAHLSSRAQVEKLINPAYIDPSRYDKVLVVGDAKHFNKLTLDKLSILAAKTEGLVEWVSDEAGKSHQILTSLTRKSHLGAFQSIGVSETLLTQGKNLTVLFKNESPVLGVWRMKVLKRGSGVASLNFFDVDFGGKLLRTYDIFFSEFKDGWYSFQLPNPIFKAQKKFAVSLKVKTLVGDPPVWVSHQGWSSHAMLIDGSKSDFVPCFETL